ncbi:hypothetical protein [Trichocoleus sp. FACHB-591]|nr:hypothetical protein [Trichocoleus sp. FACHB-591]
MEGKQDENWEKQAFLEEVWGTQPSLSGGLGANAPNGSVLKA